MMRHLLLLSLPLLLLTCGSPPTPNAFAVVDFVDSTPLGAVLFEAIRSGDTIGHFVYAADPTNGAHPILYGTTYRTPDGHIFQHWQQSDWWPGADTIWVWEGIRLSGADRWHARTITKYLPSDPDWGLVVESNENECRPRLGAAWDRTILPYVALGSAFSHIVRR